MNDFLDFSDQLINIHHVVKIYCLNPDNYESRFSVGLSLANSICLLEHFATEAARQDRYLELKDLLCI